MAYQHPSFRNRFWSFISDPDEPLSLKLFFDNFRNYSIAVVVLGSGIILDRRGTWHGTTVASYLLISLGGILALLNSSQSLALSVRVFNEFIGISTREAQEGGSRMTLKIFVAMLLPVSVLFAIYKLLEVLLTRYIH